MGVTVKLYSSRVDTDMIKGLANANERRRLHKVLMLTDIGFIKLKATQLIRWPLSLRHGFIKLKATAHGHSPRYGCGS